jgi:gliding motility-associated-like protein
LNFDVIIKPEPVLAPGGVVQTCSGAAPGSLLALGTQPGSAAIDQYLFKQVLILGGMTPAGTNAGYGIYSTNTFLENDVFTNTNNTPYNVTYTIAPSASGCPGADQIVTLQVNPAPAVSPSLSAIVCSGGVSGITLATTPSSAPARSSLGYFVTNIVQSVGAPQLQPDGVNVGINTSTGVNTNYISGDKFVNNTNVIQTVTYSVQAITTALCTGPTQDVVLTVEPTIVATPTPLVSSICSDGITNITLNSPSVPSAGPISFNYAVTSSVGGQLSGFVPSVSNLPGGTIIADILLNISNNPADATYSVTPVASGAKGGGGCAGSPVPVVVHVDPIPKLTPSPSIQTVCEGVASNIVLTTTTVPSAGGTINFNVVSVAPDVGLTSATAAGPYTSGQSIADVWSNANTFMSTAIYTLQPVVSGGLGCVGNPVTITVNVNPSPNATSTFINPTLVPAAICSNDLVNISLASDVSGTVNSWTASVTAGTAKGFAAGSGDLIFQTLKNTGVVPATVRYHVTPKASGCTGPAIDVDIEVDPIPDILLTPPSPVCYGSTLNVPLTSSVSGTTFSWVADPNNSGVDTTPANGTAINYIVKDTLSSAEDFLAFTISAVGPGATACPSADRNLTVIASPQMNGKFLNDNTSFCQGRKDFLQIQLDGQAPFTMSYTDGTSNYTLTKLGNFKSIPIQPTSPTTYQLISMKDVNGCSLALNSQVVYTVYAAITAGFTIGPIPKFVGGNATVTFTNTSAPIDATQFTYDWTFGENASPDSTSGAGPYAVNYSLPGRKTVTLMAYNNAAQAAGMSCASSVTKTFNILLDPLLAEFKVDPKRACYPTKITVVENLSTGDLFKWSVIDVQSRDTVASSNAPFPIFSISNDGSYIVRLLTSSSFTGQTATDTANVVLYPKPVPIFDAFPLTIYIPDQDVTTINGSGNTANQYLWDFGDGDTSTDYQPTHKYKMEGVDSLKFTAQYDHGGGVICSATNYKIVVAKQGGVAKIPNAFTPSTAGPSGGVGGVDLYNYVFLPQVKGVEEFNMQIYDRWGNLIFESNSQSIGWDGYDQHSKLMPAGVYVYKLTLRLSDQQRTTQVGDVTLIR